jgi:hypothetical protein
MARHLPPMTPRERLFTAFHEVGHIAMTYWRGEALHGRRVVISDDIGGLVYRPQFDLDELDLMVILGGPVSEMLSLGVTPSRAIRVAAENRDPTSDRVRCRKLIIKLRGKDDRRYQFEVQERCRAILQEPKMWEGITKAAELLSERGELDGEKIGIIFAETGVQNRWWNAGL